MRNKTPESTNVPSIGRKNKESPPSNIHNILTYVDKSPAFLCDKRKQAILRRLKIRHTKLTHTHNFILFIDDNLLNRSNVNV